MLKLLVCSGGLLKTTPELLSRTSTVPFPTFPGSDPTPPGRGATNDERDPTADSDPTDCDRCCRPFRRPDPVGGSRFSAPPSSSLLRPTILPLPYVRTGKAGPFSAPVLNPTLSPQPPSSPPRPPHETPTSTSHSPPVCPRTRRGGGSETDSAKSGFREDGKNSSGEDDRSAWEETGTPDGREEGSSGTPSKAK